MPKNESRRFGSPRIHKEVVSLKFNHEVDERLAGMIPPNVRDDPEKRREWTNRALGIGLRAMIEGSGNVDTTFVAEEFEEWYKKIDGLIGGPDSEFAELFNDPNGPIHRMFDPDNPKSPIHGVLESIKDETGKNQDAIVKLVGQILLEVGKTKAPQQAKAMGDEFEYDIESYLNHSNAKVMDDDIAVVGEEAVEGSAGAKKGDILINVEEPRTAGLRIAIEAKAGRSTGAYTLDGEDSLWSQMSESMKLRGAQAGIGVVDINGSKKHDPWMTKGRDRIIVAVDRDRGDFTLLKIAYHVLRWRIVRDHLENNAGVSASKTLDFARFDELLASILDRLKIVPKMNKNIDRATKINDGQKQSAQNLQRGIASDVAKLLSLLKSAQEEE